MSHLSIFCNYYQLHHLLANRHVLFGRYWLAAALICKL